MSDNAIPDDAEHALTAQDLADEAWAHLAMHPDARLRYRAIGLLERRLGHLRAVTAKQVELELGGLGQAAEALGITRQAVTDLYARTETPGPRADRGRSDRPAHSYGRWLALIGEAAELAGRGRQWDKLYAQSSGTTVVFPALVRESEQWLRIAARNRAKADRVARLRDKIEAADTGIDTIGLRQLTMAERGDVVLAVHRTRSERAAL